MKIWHTKLKKSLTYQDTCTYAKLNINYTLYLDCTLVHKTNYLKKWSPHLSDIIPPNRCDVISPEQV